MSETNSVVAVYEPTPSGGSGEGTAAVWVRHAEDVHRRQGLPHEEHVVGYYNTGDRMQYWARWCVLGCIWGMFWEALSSPSRASGRCW